MKTNVSKTNGYCFVESTNMNCDQNLSSELMLDDKKEESFDSNEKKKVSVNKNLIHRLHRIEGQIRGIQKMVESHRECVDIITQISASISALQSVSLIVLEDHMKTYVSESDSASTEEEAVEYWIEAVKRVVK